MQDWIKHLIDIKDQVYPPFDYFFDPSRRIFLGYLLSALLLSIFVFYRRKKHHKTSLFRYIYNSKHWFGASARVDYIIIVLNTFVKIGLIANWLYLGRHFSIYVDEFLQNTIGYNTIQLSKTTTLVSYTVCIILFNDLMVYTVHYLFHRIPFLWEFHKTHHSASSLTPFTQYRLHPVELICNNFALIFSFGLLTGIFDFMSQHSIHQWEFIGVNIFSFLFFIFGANLRHSHVQLSYPSFLENLFISPLQHQIHHSDNPKHFNKNLGSKLAIWDWLFGTLVKSKEVNELKFGIGEEEKSYATSITKNLFGPFMKWFSKKK